MSEAVPPFLLRPNNWILVSDWEEVYAAQIREIHDEGIVTTTGAAVAAEDIMGIPITTAHLIQTGFIPHSDGHYTFPGWPVSIIPHTYFACYIGETEIAGLRFVHDLQNLYIGMKQRELPIRPGEER